MPENLELRCKKAIINIAGQVKDINYKLSHFLQCYREDYYTTLNGINYQKHLKEYQ